LRRFIPGVVGFLGCGLYLTARIKGITLGQPQIAGFTNLTLFMTLGFVASLLVARPVLAAAAGVDGRRSLLAGFASPCVLLVLGMLHGSPLSHMINYAFAFASGATVTMAMFARQIGKRAASGSPGDIPNTEPGARSISLESRAASVVPAPR
jgi:hypothetical protein